VDEESLAGDDPRRSLQHLEGGRVVEDEADGGDRVDAVGHRD
jgi:hypothetical protein